MQMAEQAGLVFRHWIATPSEMIRPWHHQLHHHHLLHPYSQSFKPKPMKNISYLAKHGAYYLPCP
jgi:hypothetical protein